MMRRVDESVYEMWNNEDDVTPDEPIKWIGKSNLKDALYRDVEEAKPCIISTRFEKQKSLMI